MFICLPNLWNFNDFIVSLYCGLNLLFNVVRRPSIVLHLSFSICVNDSRNYRLFLPSHFYDCYLFCLWHAIWFCLPLVWKFLSSLHLSSTSQLNMGCSIMGLPGLGTAFCVLSAPATTMTCIAVLVTSATACANASLVFVSSLATLCICTLSAYVFLYETLHLTPCSVSCLSEDNTSWCICAYLLLLHISRSWCVFTCVHDYIYSDSAL